MKDSQNTSERDKDGVVTLGANGDNPESFRVIICGRAAGNAMIRQHLARLQQAKARGNPALAKGTREEPMIAGLVCAGDHTPDALKEYLADNSPDRVDIDFSYIDLAGLGVSDLISPRINGKAKRLPRNNARRTNVIEDDLADAAILSVFLVAEQAYGNPFMRDAAAVESGYDNTRAMVFMCNHGQHRSTAYFQAAMCVYMLARRYGLGPKLDKYETPKINRQRLRMDARQVFQRMYNPQEERQYGDEDKVDPYPHIIDRAIILAAHIFEKLGDQQQPVDRIKEIIATGAVAFDRCMASKATPKMQRTVTTIQP